MTPSALAPAAVAVLIAFSLYRRFRGLFGRQRVQPLRMKTRIALLLFVGAFLALRAGRDGAVLAVAAAGLAGGVALAWLGLRWTRFETTPQGDFYTPHAAIGLVVTLLLVGRLAYRFVVLYPALRSAQQAGADPFAGLQHSPPTTAVLALFIGYYVAYYAGLLARAAAARPARGA